MPVPIANGPRCRGPLIGVALGPLLALAACADPPTDTTAGPDGGLTARPPAAIATSPTISPLVTAECGLDGFQHAFESLAGGDACKIVLRPQISLAEAAA